MKPFKKTVGGISLIAGLLLGCNSQPNLNDYSNPRIIEILNKLELKQGDELELVYDSKVYFDITGDSNPVSNCFGPEPNLERLLLYSNSAKTDENKNYVKGLIDIVNYSNLKKLDLRFTHGFEDNPLVSLIPTPEDNTRDLVDGILVFYKNDLSSKGMQGLLDSKEIISKHYGDIPLYFTYSNN